MLYPKNLEKGCKIGVTAPSAGFADEPDLIRLESGIKHFNQLGYSVVTTENVRKCEKGRSGDGAARARECMELFLDPEVRAIISASGGDYLVEMLPYLDLEAIGRNPKWVQGFSDNTGLVLTLTTSLDMATVYGYNFSSFGMEKWHPSLGDHIALLEGQNIVQQSSCRHQTGYYPRITGLEEFVLTEETRWVNLKPGSRQGGEELAMRGRALGGCLDVCLCLAGTRYDKVREFCHRYREDRILWYLESYELNTEAMIRGLWQLREAGWFEHACGFVFGRPCMYESHTDTSYGEAVLSVLGELGLPVILDADIGHKPPQFAMINGAIATVRSSHGAGNISFERK
ncbi:muramoyltetrapeptide carboxypeptidase LdcA involved in peptidoglycan recycling [Anaerotaenia torta]|uniref:S66 family peptidase n=1 Tax=Anaerotaenia torta TaxID=433293 RepID=UPI003D1CC5F6